MKTIILTFILFMAAFFNIKAQLQDRIWIFGRPTSGTSNAVFNFSNLSNPTFTLPIGQPSQIASNDGMEQWGVVANPTTGDLIFYTDGRSVFNNQHQLVDIDPGISGYELLGANISCTQPVAISVLPKPPYDQYVIFSNPTGSIDGSIWVGPITYRLFNTITNNFGPIQMLPGLYSSANVTEGMKIIPCTTNPNKLWLITSIFPSSGMLNRYVVYKIQSNIITYEGFYDFGPVKQTLGGTGSPLVNMKYSNTNITNITNVGVSLQHTSRVFIIQFNNETGVFLTNTIKEYNPGYSSIPSIYDLEFSSDGRFLYYSVYYTSSTTNELYQLDLQDNILTPTLIKTFPTRYAGGLKRGPDGLVYHINDAGYEGALRVGRILQPNVKFITNVTNINSFYQDNFHTYPSLISWAFCETSLFPNFNVKIYDISSNSELNIYPNPVKNTLNFMNAEEFDQITICNNLGLVVFEERTNKTEFINVESLSSGVYYLILKKDRSSSRILKFIKI